MKVNVKNTNPPLGGILTAEYYKSLTKDVTISWGTESFVQIPNVSNSIAYSTSNDIIRILEKTYNLEAEPLQKVALNHWLSFTLSLQNDLTNSLEYFDRTLGPITYLIGESVSAADLAVFSVLYVTPGITEILKSKEYNNIIRWMRLIQSQPFVSKTLNELPSDVTANLFKKQLIKKAQSPENTVGRQQEGKFVELPYAEMGKVVVRFPPEASGYLHIGHAKAALLNQYYQQAFQGKLIMRFDDTNPAKENAEFEKVILEDVEMLEIEPDRFTHTSEYFDLMLEYCEKLIKEGKAFVDDTPAEQMKTERDQKVDSKNKNNSVEKNLQLWEEMKLGSQIGIKCCVRAKIDMQSTNGCLRDPTIYRCKPEEHPRTGKKYKVYPTYDFACPIVDSLEDVTHVLRTMEYHDRDPQFYWFIDALGLRKPYIWEYSRLSMTNTVLSKRKLTWFVEEGLVDGWDDPRMPTVRGVLRRGMTVEGLRQFIQAQGSSRSVVFMEWDKIWAINKKVIDPIASRYTALEPNPVPVNLKGVVGESTLTVALHPKNSDIGNKTIWLSQRLLIDQVDAKGLKEGENATFINYGNVMIDKIHRLPDGTVSSIDATPNLENKDFKKTLKLTWLADTPNSLMVETYCVYFDHILSKPLLGKDEDFKQYIGHQTRWEVPMLGEPELLKLHQGDIIQLQRRGFFRVDVAPAPPSPLSGKARPLILFHIPDGHTKDMPGQPKQIVTASQSKRTPASNSSVEGVDQLNRRISEQGDLVRSLKAAKAEKAKIDEAVKALLELKSQYKTASGQDWKPGVISIVCTPSKPEPADHRVGDLVSKIAKQGDTVRQLKAQKADKSTVEAEVKRLLSLKADYKKETGTDWTPNAQAIQSATQVQPDAVELEGGDTKIADLLAKIAKQGDLVRQLKGQKAAKPTIDVEVKTLLELKSTYKKETGKDWTPNAQESLVQVQPVTSKTKDGNTKVTDLLEKIAKQGDQVRLIKAQKADKTSIDAEVKNLLALKAEFKKETGKDWTPNVKVQPSPHPVMNGNDREQTLAAEVAKQGEVVRQLKSNKTEKAAIDAEVKKLLELKAKYQAETGKTYTPPAQPVGDANPKEKKEEKKEAKVKEAKPKEKKTKEQSPKPPANQKDESATGVKKITRLGLEASKETDLPEWYSQVITKAEMIEYYDISGCYILRPWSFGIWDLIREFLSAHFKKLGVKDCYFPMFVSKAVLEREKKHIADFAPEVAWVTHSGSSELAEHIAVRPTSETGMYPAYAKWIQSHRDLPLKLNQWNNVVRWEFKQPQPFIRTREFLWQEGHTAYLLKQEADEEVLTILDLYARVYEELLAIPVIRGRKTEKEKFAGGDYTTTLEAYVPANGRAVQGATSHHLGQNFAKMFEIIYDDPETQEKKYVYQNSWGLTTRTIGVMILVHGDDRGLVLPPRVATVQAIIIPCGITASSTKEERKNLMDSCKTLEEELCKAGVRAEGDYRDNYSPGWKFNHWELKGVPVRIELGPKDLAKGEIVAVVRLTGEKTTYKRATASNVILALLKKIHDEMLTKATVERDSRLSMAASWDDFTSALERKHILLVPFCGETPCEDNIKNDSARLEEDNATEVKAPAMGAKSLCIPFEQPRTLSPDDKCIHPKCTNKPKYFTLFGRSY